MKTLVSSYTFDASAKTITFTALGSIDIENVLIITNVVDNIIIYQFNNPLLGGTAATNVLTLTYNTTAMSDTDELQIWYWDPLATQSVSGTIDVNGVVPGIGASALGKSSGNTYTNGEVGVASWGVANEAGASLSSDGTYCPVAVDTRGYIYANVDNNLSLLATKAEDAASADGHLGFPVLAVRKATPANTSGTDGDYEFIQMSAGRVWASATIDAALPAGTNAIGKLAPNTGVDIGDVDVTSIIPGTSATNLGKAEDAAHASGDTGVMMLAVRQSTPTDLSAGATNGDYEPLQVNEVGSQWVTPTPSANGGTSVYHLVSAGSTNATVVKASAGTLIGWYIYNSNASARKVVFHNTASTPTAGASVYFSLVIPPTSGANILGGIAIGFSSGIAITTVTGLADSDNTAVASNDLIINLFYK